VYCVHETDFKFVAVAPLPSLSQHTPGQHVRWEIIELFHLPFIHTGQIGDDTCLLPFVQEMSMYQQISRQYIADNTEQEDPDSDTYLKFWRQNVLTLPHFSLLARKMAACSPSSATVERLFSILASFNDNQSNALADYAKARTMIRYNYNFRQRSDYWNEQA